MKHTKLNMKQFCEMLANCMAYADNQTKGLMHMQENDDLLQQMPSEVVSGLQKAGELYCGLIHLVVGACEAGVISREAMMEYVSTQYGKKGAARLEKIFEEHQACWDSIKASAPEFNYTIPPK